RSGFHGNVDVAEVLVDAKTGPRTGVTRVIVRTVQPRFRTRLTFPGHRMEDPDSFSGADIETHDVALHVFLVGDRAGQQRRTDHDHVVRDHGRGAVADVAGGIAFEIQIQLLE